MSNVFFQPNAVVFGARPVMHFRPVVSQLSFDLDQNHRAIVGPCVAAVVKHGEVIASGHKAINMMNAPLRTKLDKNHSYESVNGQYRLYKNFDVIATGEKALRKIRKFHQ